MTKPEIILYIVEDTESAQFRYRVKNVVDALEASSKWKAKWVLTSDFKDTDLNGVDVVVVLRQSGKDGQVLKIIEKARAKGLKVLFDLDDLIFDYRDLPILMRGTNSKNIFYWAGYMWGIRRIAKKVDGFIATNGFLANKLKRSFAKPCAIIPNSLNKEQVKISDELVKDKIKNKKTGFSIGYFSGSPTHKRDFGLVESEIVKFLDTHDDAVLEVVGYMEFSDKIKKLIDSGKLRVAELMDYLELQKTVSEVDVNIAPLVINDFTNCKSELKFFEAAAVETVTIASPSYTFKKAISDGKNGLLAKTGEWYNKLELLYGDLEKRAEMAKEARKYALENYYGEKFLKEVEKAYDSIEKS